MAILKKKRNLIVPAAVVAVGVVALLSYRFLPALLQVRERTTALEPNLAVPREVSTIAAYQTPGGINKVRFTLDLDARGAVVAVKSTDVLKGDAVSEKLVKFSEGLLLVIRGKKLSELTSVDRIGKSSLTTAAFNAALPDLQKQL